MEWLTHNPIADMYGPNFLVLYGTLIVLTLLVCRWMVLNAGRVDDAMPVAIPSQPDPYEIAYLRGGEMEVLQVIVFGLMQRGFLMPGGTSSKRIERHLEPPDSKTLTDMERTVYQCFDTPRTMREAVVRLGNSLQKHCLPYDWSLRQNRLLASGETVQSVQKIKIAALSLIVGLGVYKLMIAVSRGRSNVFFLIIMTGLAFFFIIRICRTPRLSARGKDYLQKLQSTFQMMKTNITQGDALQGQTVALIIGIFGAAVLADTAYGAMLTALDPARTTSGGFGDSSGGSDSGGGCSGGGGCGGGGGGCGGCGGGD